jgi:SPP1 gp7 family putative phage head morphogenesis protein
MPDPVARVLAKLYSRIGADIRARGGGSLGHWLPVMAEALRPLLYPHWRAGALQAASRIQRARRGKKKALAFTKDASQPTPGIGWDVFNRRILDALDTALLVFCQATLETARVEASKVQAAVQHELAEGLVRGDGTKLLNARLYSVFNDPLRASRVAQTETSRATHAGQLLAAKESGVVSGLKWLASSDACDRCRSLNGKVVALGEPFEVDPKGGPYAVVAHPPLHPHCFCTTTEVIDHDALVGESRR